jgi:hypothetical protein
MLLVAADGQRFHCAINVVPDPARQSQRARFMVNKPTKAYTLHASANNVTFGNHRKLLGTSSELRPRKVRAFGRIHTDFFTFIDEWRHLHHQTGFSLRRLGHAGSRG